MVLVFENPIQEGVFRQRAYYDLGYFIENVFAIELASFHKDMLRLLFRGQLVLLVLPRGFGKTTLISVGYTLWQLWRGMNRSIVIFSASREQSEGIIKLIQDKILSEPFFKNLVPSGRELKWNKHQIETSMGSMVSIRSLKPTSRGIRPDCIICDDILRDERYTQEQVKELFWSVIYPASDSGRGQIVLVGTPMSMDDLFYDLQYPAKDKLSLLDSAGLLPVVGKWQAVLMDDNGGWLKPLWENHTQFGSLRKLSATQALMGSLRFDREYLCNPMAGGASIFTEALLSRRHTVMHTGRVKGWDYYMGCDIALADESMSDYSVYTVIGRDENKNLFVVRMERYRGKSTEEQIERIKQLHKIFNFRKLVVEENGLSKGLALTLSQDTVVKSVFSGFVTTKNNKELLISNIQSALATGTLTLLDNEVLINELRCFSKVVRRDTMGRITKETYEGVGSKDDCVMSLGLALEAVYLKKSMYSFSVI